MIETEDMDGGFGLTPLGDHLAAPRGRGRLRDAPHAGAAGGAPCGDTVRLALAVEHGWVVDAGFDAGGCAAAVAAASATVELVSGRPALAAARVTPDAIAAALGGLAPERRHAAALAADALHAALGRAAADGAIELAPSRDRTLVAMSGGVDSAVAAQLALDRGDEVVAVTLELWSDAAGDGERSCCSPQAVVGARALAHRMGLPHLTLDVRERFADSVVADFVAEHAAGRTPNPCVRCNGLVRFDEMLTLADALGAARLATGHYARVTSDAGGRLLARARSDAKDQSYMLCRLGGDELDRVWFPLGELTKEEVRARARAAALPVADKRESQDLCFLAGLGAQRFLERHGGFDASRPGPLVDSAGRVVGEHGGQHRFTVGQRRGLRLATGEAMYVLRKDAPTNTVVVGDRGRLAAGRVTLAPAVLHRPGAQVDRVKLRYRSRPVHCRLDDDLAAGAHACAAITLEDSVHAVAPGQTACLMRGGAVIGWGTISDSETAPQEAAMQESVNAG